MRVGWLVDTPQYIGGAERNAAAFAENCPQSVQIVPCPPDGIVEDVDCYVIHNCTQYTAAILPIISKKPVYKMVHDVWPHGDERLKNWLLANSEVVILVSPKIHDWMGWDIEAELRCIPSPIDTQRFKDTDKTGRKGSLWLGNARFPHKGFSEALRWSQETKQPLTAYGDGTEGGPVRYENVPALMSQFERFVFLPTGKDPCPRVVFEAWYAGCELVVNDNQGATWWIENEPDAIENATDRFWSVICG